MSLDVSFVQAALSCNAKLVEAHAPKDVLDMYRELDPFMQTPKALCLLVKNIVLNDKRVRCFLACRGAASLDTIFVRECLVMLYGLIVDKHCGDVVHKALVKALKMPEKQVASVCVSTRMADDFIRSLSNRDDRRKAR